MRKRPPRLFICLLASVVVARVAIVFVVHSPLTTGLMWAALLGALSLGALYGKRAAATMLGWVCVALGLDVLLQLATVEVPATHLAAALAWAGLVTGTGVYILRSVALRRFYER